LFDTLCSGIILMNATIKHEEARYEIKGVAMQKHTEKISCTATPALYIPSEVAPKK
jgi:hypothetical protein